MKKYDIVIVGLVESGEAVQQGTRPCIILQSNLLNARYHTLIVMPITSNTERCFPGEFLMEPTSDNGLHLPSKVLGRQILTIHTSMVVNRIGTLDDVYKKQLQDALSIVLDLEDDFVDE